jgi:hypothetical protein
VLSAQQVGTVGFIVYVEVEMMQVCGPIMMAIILQFSLCLHEMQWLMIRVDDCLLPENVMSPLATSFHKRVHLFVISRVLKNNI